MFSHLHLHTQYSLLNGAIRIADLPAALKQHGYQSCAITDTGSMAGVVEFYVTLKQAGLKPLIGMEAFVTDGACTERHYSQAGPNASRLVLICQHRQGYENLMKLSGRGYTQGKYYVPRVDRELLKAHQEGLIAISWGTKGMLGSLIKREQHEKARETAQWLGATFNERFYVGLQHHGLEEQVRLNADLIALAKTLGLPLVAGNDCHYLKAEEAESQHLLRLIGWQKTLATVGPAKSDQFYLRSPAEMAEAMKIYPAEVLENTERIASSCQLSLENSTLHLPKFDLPPEASDEDSWLQQWAAEQLEARLADLAQRYQIPPEEKDTWVKKYQERLRRELEVICRMKYSGYFLIVADFINWAKQNGVRVGPGRGSGAGSLVAYALSITDLDPLYHGLLFERFLNAGRISMPDFDVDFDVAGRERVLEYVRQKYGRNRVCQISTYGTLGAKAAVRNVARVLDFNYSDADKIARLIPDKLGITLQEAIRLEAELAHMEKEGSPQERQLLKHAHRLEGLHSTQSTHAAGVIIMDCSVESVMPICTDKSGQGIQSQFPMKWVEHQGGVKFDFLGLNNLTIIKHAVELINRSPAANAPQLDINAIPLDDPLVFQMLGRGETTGIFQLESGGMRRLLIDLKPDRFSDLVAILALYRPGPLESGMTRDFVERKNKRQPIQSPHPQLDEVLRETHGVLAYQEQVMQAARILAGFNLGEADILRRAMGKKDPKEMAQQRERFVQGCLKNDITKKDANQLFNQIDKFAGYGFNKSHSAAYGLLAYQTAWLKCHHSVAFMSALLSSEMGNTDRVVNDIAECRDMNIEVLVPDINESNVDFDAHSHGVRFGLNAVRNVGLAAAKAIVETRNQQPHGKFADLHTFLHQINPRVVNKRALEALIQCGALDSLHHNRAQLLKALPELIQVVQQNQLMQQQGQENIFGHLPSGQAQAQELNLKLPECPPFEPHQRLHLEKEALGFYVSGHPLQAYASEQKQLTTHSIHKLRSSETAPSSPLRVAGVIQSHKIRLNRNSEKYAIARLLDTRAALELVVFAHVYAQCVPLLESDEPLLIEGHLQKQEQELRLQADWIVSLDSYRQQHAQRLEIPVQDPHCLPPLADTLNQLKSSGCQVALKISTPTAEILLDTGLAINPSPENIGKLSWLKAELAFFYPPINSAAEHPLTGELSGAKFSGAKFSNAQFSAAKLSGEKLSGDKLSGEKAFNDKASRCQSLQ